MKKIVSVALVLAMLFTLAACEAETNTAIYSTGINKEGMYDLKANDYVSLTEYIGMEIPADEIKISDSDVQAQIDAIANAYKTTNQITDREIVDGDRVNIDYSGSVDGVQFDGGTATGQTVAAGSQEFVDDFLDQIIGHTAGDSFDVNVTFPEVYENNPDLAGKDAVFFVVINYIEESIPADVNDEFVSQYYKDDYGLTTLEELKQYIKDDLGNTKMMNYIDDYLFTACTCSDIPDAVKEHQANIIRGNFEDTAASYGVDMDTLLAYSGVSTIEELIEQSADEISEMSKDILIYQAIAEKENIKVSNNDVADYFEKLTGSRDYENYQEHYGLPYLKQMILTKKVSDFIIDNSK